MDLFAANKGDLFVHGLMGTIELDHARTMYSISIWTVSLRFNFANFFSCKNKSLPKINWFTVKHSMLHMSHFVTKLMNDV